MLALDPSRVSFGGQAWEGVVSIVIDRSARAEVAEGGDRGPHVVFADAADRLAEVTVVRVLTATDLDAPRPGETGLLEFVAGVGPGDRARVRVRATAVVMEVRHELPGGGATGAGVAARRKVRMVAVSADGAADPIEVTAA